MFGRIRDGPSEKLADLLANLLLGKTDVIGGLKVEPELRRGAKPVAEAERCVAGDAPHAMDDLGDAVGRHLDLPGELGRRDAKLLQRESVTDSESQPTQTIQHSSGRALRRICGLAI